MRRMRRDVSILKLDNFVHKVGGRDKYEEIKTEYNKHTHTMKELAKNFGFSESMFNDYFNNAAVLIAIDRPETKAHLEWKNHIEQSRPEDDRVREATNILRLLQSGDRKVQEKNG